MVLRTFLHDQTTIESGQNAYRESGEGISVIFSSHCVDLAESKEGEAGWLKMVVGIVNRKGTGEMCSG